MFLNKVIYYGRLNFANVLLLFHFLSILRLTMSFWNLLLGKKENIWNLLNGHLVSQQPSIHEVIVMILRVEGTSIGKNNNKKFLCLPLCSKPCTFALHAIIKSWQIWYPTSWYNLKALIAIEEDDRAVVSSASPSSEPWHYRASSSLW